MRATASRFALVLSGVFACRAEPAGGDEGVAGATGGTPSGAGGASGTAGTPGNGGAYAGSAATTGTSGATSTAGSSGAPNQAGGASASGNGGSGGGIPSGASGTGEAGSAGRNAGASGSAGANGSAGEGGGQSGSAGTGGDQSGSAGTSGGQSGSTGTGGDPGEPLGLSWPIDCVPDQSCVNLGYPDTDDDGVAHDCSEPGYIGHEGTDIGITFDAQATGTAVRAAADGVVLFAFDGKYDQCPNATEPDCQEPPSLEPGGTTGNTVCTPLGPYCTSGDGECYWCFAGGNVIVVQHDGVPGVFATRYDHLKENSVLVEPGDTVSRGEKLAEAASSGNSTGPHLHFEVWGEGFYDVADPWAGPCGPNTGPSLWAYDPPWSE